ncbi:MAG: hypothetical protein IJ228_02955 [Succinivibrio sp.]|nr:hypothetical protein [Succinivibrio sp.]
MAQEVVRAYVIAIRERDRGEDVHLFALRDSDDPYLADKVTVSLCENYDLEPDYGEGEPIMKDFIERHPGEDDESFELRTRMAMAKVGRKMCPECVARLYESLI